MADSREEVVGLFAIPFGATSDVMQKFHSSLNQFLQVLPDFCM